jgi:hypothetical protein
VVEWAVAYLITCLVEIPLVVMLTGGLGWRAHRAPRAVAIAWMVQFTHPLLWLVNPSSLWGVVIAELVVVAVEGTALTWWAVTRAGASRTPGTLERALLVAFIANATSLLVGLVVFLSMRGFWT